jgi:hypothetical protein
MPEPRCTCPHCRDLDRRFPGEGYQLALTPPPNLTGKRQSAKER